MKSSTIDMKETPLDWYRVNDLERAFEEQSEAIRQLQQTVKEMSESLQQTVKEVSHVHALISALAHRIDQLHLSNARFGLRR